MDLLKKLFPTCRIMDVYAPARGYEFHLIQGSALKILFAFYPNGIGKRDAQGRVDSRAYVFYRGFMPAVEFYPLVADIPGYVQP